jgi:hypothetical protein
MEERVPTPDARGAWRPIAVVGLLVALGGVAAMVSPWLDPPANEAAPAAFAAYYQAERDGLLVLAYLNALGMAAIAAVFVALREALGRWQPTWAAVGLAAGLLTLAMTLAGFVVLAALAYRGGEAESARQLTDLGWLLIDLAAGPPTALSIGAFTAALARSPASRPWLLGLGAIAAAAHLVVAGAFAADGALSPAGLVAHVVPCLWFAWVASACLVLLRLSRATAPTAAAAGR